MPHADPAYAAALRRDGYDIHECAVSTDEVVALQRAVALVEGQEVRRKRSVYGVRNLLEVCPAIARLAAAPELHALVAPILGDEAFAVRAIFFDKSPGGNWSLCWHQDNVISVRERREAPGFEGWASKAGVWQVQPPAEVLANMLALRVHLDDSTHDNGPLRVLPGSHVHGWIDDLDDWKRRVPEVVCTVRAGGILAMRPLLLHASALSASTAHRRVIHIEYALDELPHGLTWNNRIRTSALHADKETGTG